MFFDDRYKFRGQKSNSSNCNSTFSVFSVFNTQTVRHVLKNLAIFSIHVRQIHYAFQETSKSVILQHITSVTCQHSSHIVNTWSVHICKEIFKNTLRTYFSRIKILVFCYPIINLLYSIQSKVFGIVTTLRDGRLGNRFSKYMNAWGAQTVYCTRGTRITSEARWPGFEFNVSFLPCCEIKNGWSYTSPTESPQYTI